MRAGTVFTTHTPVPAGIDRFPVDMVKHYFSAGVLPGVPTERVLALGAEENPAMFNMAHMGLRLGQRANGVSQLHGAVSRGMFGGLWDGFDADEVPIGSVTNGVHGATWEAREIAELLGEPGPPTRREVADEQLWQLRNALRARLVDEVRRRVREAWLQRGASSRAGLDRPRLRPGRAHRRVRPPRAHLQAAHADAARQGPAARRCCWTRSGRCSSSSRARATRPTTAARR